MGVRFGIDVGRARIGVAKSDPDGLLATPLETVSRAEVWDELRYLLPDAAGRGAGASAGLGADAAGYGSGTGAGVGSSAGASGGASGGASIASAVLPPLPAALREEIREAFAAGELTDLARILQLLEESGAVRVCVGHPRNLRGEATASTRDAELFAQALAFLLAARGSSADVLLVDERLSTVTASAQLASAGKRGRGTRQIVDQAAAVVILQQALETERNLGRMPGILVSATEEGEA